MTTFVETKQKRKGKCKTKNKRMELTRVLSSPIEHIIKKSNEANMNDKQLLMYCLTEYDKIINDDTKNHSDYIRSMQEQISEANEDDYVTIGKIFKLILSKSEQSSNIVKFLIKTIPDADFTEVMKGGNHIVNDGGGLCDYIVKKFPETYVRFSGHYNDKTKNTYTGPQMGITGYVGDFVIHIVFGIIEFPGKKRVTWFQTEGSPNPPGSDLFGVVKNIISEPSKATRRTNEFVKHGADYFVYKYFDENIGAIGASVITDKSPKIIELDNTKLTNEKHKFKTISEVEKAITSSNQLIVPKPISIGGKKTRKKYCKNPNINHENGSLNRYQLSLIINNNLL